MSRISSRFGEIIKKGKKAFIPYIMAGDPDISRTKEVIGILEDCGADIIELGVPFSDPLADGPVIQKAGQRALEQGVRLRSVIELVAEVRKTTSIPIILMTYYNPVFKYGEEKFVHDATTAGVDGLIAPDMLPEEAGSLVRFAKKSGMDTIFLLAPTSTEDRIRKVSKAATGFVYYVSITGITGAKLSMDHAIASHISKIREISGKPVAVGFGISTPEEASEVSRLADGVIVGSAVVKRVADSDEELRKYLFSLRRAIG
ncbi:MAG: tryptophan synthase subunit alpha [Nitrospirota bacterium]|nr:tryptophan synthase subunit alpha [Nitrospirota bacterium]